MMPLQLSQNLRQLPQTEKTIKLKNYQVEYYNLEMVTSVGYRVECVAISYVLMIDMIL